MLCVFFVCVDLCLSLSLFIVPCNLNVVVCMFLSFLFSYILLGLLLLTSYIILIILSITVYYLYSFVTISTIISYGNVARKQEAMPMEVKVEIA